MNGVLRDFGAAKQLLLYTVLFVGEPDHRKGHVDYVPSLFGFNKSAEASSTLRMQEREAKCVNKRLREMTGQPLVAAFVAFVVLSGQAFSTAKMC